MSRSSSKLLVAVQRRIRWLRSNGNPLAAGGIRVSKGVNPFGRDPTDEPVGGESREAGLSGRGPAAIRWPAGETASRKGWGIGAEHPHPDVTLYPTPGCGCACARHSLGPCPNGILSCSGTRIRSSLSCADRFASARHSHTLTDSHPLVTLIR